MEDLDSVRSAALFEEAKELRERLRQATVQLDQTVKFIKDLIDDCPVCLGHDPKCLCGKARLVLSNLKQQ